MFVARARSEDVRDLAALAAACHPHPWTTAQIAADVAVPSPSAVLLLRTVTAGGETRLCAACTYRVLLDEAQILDVSVDPGWRRRGLGRFLLALAIRRAAAAGARTALLEVRAGNRAARQLYASLGFAPCGRRRGYYRSPTEDAILLARRIEGSQP